MASSEYIRYSPLAIRHSLFSLLHTQRERRSRTVAARRRFDTGVAANRDGATGAGGRDKFFARAAGQIAIASGAALLAQRMEARRTGRAGRALRTDRAGVALLSGRSLRSRLARLACGACRAFKTSCERNRREQCNNGQ